MFLSDIGVAAVGDVRVLIYHLDHGYPCSGDHFVDVIEIRLGRLRNAVADFQSL